MTRILITGGSSYLGRHLVPLAGASYETSYTFLHNDPLNLQSGYRLDIRDEAAVLNLVKTLRPDVIIHTIGSNRPAEMSDVITRGTNHVTQAAQNSGARLIHISTDVVFNGRDAPYDESAPPAPMHDYGRAKARAEEIVSTYDNHVIIRTSLIYGLMIMDHGTAWVVDALSSGRPVTLFTNQRRNPIWVETLCHACLELAMHDYRGILNVAGKQELTRAEFGLRMLDWWQIRERKTLALGQADGDRWPADCTLDLRRAAAILSTPLPGVDEVLARLKP
jgi:dTDP-4-dehydrorhamnose reductase